jgi:23S rRNA pseudouridine1911/1915/1917 synthase
MYRVYHALVSGGFREDEGTVDLPIGRHARDRKKMAVVAGGREARTHYRVLGRFGQVSYLSLRLETGRTHQIRVHMSAKGHPLLGDTTYGGGNTPFERRHASLLSGQCLHAKELSFTHPRTGERMSFSCPLPDDFVRLLEILQAEQ